MYILVQMRTREVGIQEINFKKKIVPTKGIGISEIKTLVFNQVH